MKRTYLLALFAVPLLFGIPQAAQSQQGLDTLSLKSIFYEPLLAGNRPDFVTFSPDMEYVYYQANDSSKMENETYRVRLNGKNKGEAPKSFERNYVISADGKTIAYADGGDIWLANTDYENKRKLIDSKKAEYSPAWSPSGKRLAFIQDGDAWIMDVNSSRLTQVTQKADDETGYIISGWAGSDKLVLFQWDTSDYNEYFFPEYVHQYVQSGSSRRGVANQIVSVAYLDSSKVNVMFEGKEYINTDISASGRYLAVDRLDGPMKHRTITVFDLQEPKSTIVFEDSTQGWIYGRDMEFAPEGEILMFQSEKDGWNHIYTVDANGNGLKQHTSGSYDIPWAEWIDGNRMVFASSEVDPGERHLYTLDIRDSSTRKLTSRTGYRQSFELSRDKRYAVYEYTHFNEPFELYLLDLRRPREEVRLTHTIPDRFRQIGWQKEDYIRFTARDGETQLSMSVLEPLNKSEGLQHPVVVFVHGAGSLQNVYKGWSNSYYREYMFHQYLTAKGYYVMEVDYRHSTGYGRKFREDVTDWMGKYETRDIVDGINYLAANYPQADTSRVGVYGGSYGGFMALYATSTAPDYFDAAAALRAVTNWENYYHTNPWYTWPRLGTPEADSANYARSSPITYVEELQHPVLILHGLIDNNVGFQDAAQYIDKLIQEGDKEFEMMMYPTERHSFRDPDAWYDEYSRIYEFFEEHLK